MIVRARFRAEEIEPGMPVSADARLLALAYVVEAAVESGQFRSAAEFARALGLTRARVSQVMRRRWTLVAEQERILLGG